MILKNLTRRSGTHQLLSYLFEKQRKTPEGKEKQLIIRHNIRSRASVKKWKKEFDQNESYRLRRRKDNVKLHHTILSISNKDSHLVDDKMLRSIAHKYFELRGPQNMYLATVHQDKDHTHIHIVSPGVEYLTGKSNRISKSEFNGLKKALDEFQRTKYPELVNSLPQHGKSKEKRIGEISKPIQNKNIRENQKQSLTKTLEKAYSDAHSLDQFLSQIKAHGHEPYYRSGRLQGIKYDGERKYRLSRLGFDKERIEHLIQIENEEKQALKELQGLRGRNSPSRGREVKEVVEPEQVGIERKEFNEDPVEEQENEEEEIEEKEVEDDPEEDDKEDDKDETETDDFYDDDREEESELEP